MKTTLDFEKVETKNLLAKLDFSFFLEKNIESQDYSELDTQMIYHNYDKTLQQLKKKLKHNKEQFCYFAEGQVRKMFTGGFIPALFELDEGREHVFFDFPAIGENWAYFEIWQSFHRKKITKEKIWTFVIRLGSILAIILSILKLIETIK